ncbi:SAM-dependent methyltransferase [Aeromicrobium sp. UC242_57]|uniref:SAM-dependent methyltransferase n=1 Tax=Aeromicrobium sp. UC242_57 TaxID=3374624 RepID=UPI0037AE891C
MKVLIAGVGMGLQHVTSEVAQALRGADYVIAATKGPDDELLAARRVIADHFGLEVVAVADPERDRKDPADYPAAVKTWHEARVAAYEQVLRARGGTAAFLVWGDPSLYDSTIRIVEQLRDPDAARLHRPARHLGASGARRPAPDRAAPGGCPRARHDRETPARGCRGGTEQHRGHARSEPRPRRPRRLVDLVGRKPRD